jgi:hypothetical protein
VNRILCRVIEGVAVTLGVSGTLWLVHHPSGGAALLDQAADTAGRLDHGWTVTAWTLAAVLCGLGALLGLERWRRNCDGWDIGIDFPSWPTTLLAAGSLFGLAAWGLQACALGKASGMMPLLLAVWGAWRLFESVRRQLAWSSQLL